VVAQQASSHAEALLARAERLVDPEVWGPWDPPVEATLDSELCRLESGRARDEVDSDGWAAYAERADQHDRRPRVAYARYREAEASLVRGDRRDNAVAALDAAASDARRLGCAPLLGDIEALARRGRITLVDPVGDLGSDADRDAPHGASPPFDLTPREYEVLGLIGRGLTNREIGAALFMSPKTASVHVSRILAKLGVRSRVEAAGVAHRLGLVDDAR
jgi:DNA-binding CsgD family transcriptional regulator